MRILFLSIFVLLFFWSCNRKEAYAPNIVFIVLDDVGYGSLGCYGGESDTKNMDSLANKGLVFRDFHSNAPICTPSRVSFLTGKYPHRMKLENQLFAKGDTRLYGLPEKEVTFVELLKEQGYETGITGKWGLGFSIEYNPIYQGFNYFRGFMSSHIDDIRHIDDAGVPDWWQDLEKIHEEGSAREMILRYSTEFIESNKESPFFLMVSFPSPKNPEHTDSLSAVGAYRESYRKYLEELDGFIGSIVNKINSDALSENTLIFLCSDNGPDASLNETDYLRGGANSLLEGGHRVPAIAYWPGTIRPGVTDQLILGMDLFPTFLSLTKNANFPYKIDGIDFSDLMTGSRTGFDRQVYWKYKNQKAVRNQQYKLLIEGQNKYLFNLDEDPEERFNLLEENPEVGFDMEEQFRQWEIMIKSKQYE